MEFEIGDKVSVWDGQYVGAITAKNVGGIPTLYVVTSETMWPKEYVFNSYQACFFDVEITLLEN